MSVYTSLLLLSLIAWTFPSFFTHHLMAIWTFSIGVGAMINKAIINICVYRFLFQYKIARLLGEYLGVASLGCMVFV